MVKDSDDGEKNSGNLIATQNVIEENNGKIELITVQSE